jgi:YVTN family beta-propeller protein
LAAVTGLDLGGGVVLDTVWSATDLQVVARQVIALEVAPIDLATNPGKGLVYALATPFGQKTGGPPMVMTIDATTNQPVDTVVLEAANPYALGVNTASEKVYVSDFQNQLIVVHAGAGTVGTIPLPQPGFTTVDETKNVVYVPAGFQVGLDPSCVASFCPIYAPVLFKVDGVADTVFTADTVFVGGWDWHAYGAAFNPNDGLVYVAIYDSTLVARNVVRIVDPGSRAIVGSIDVPGKPFALAINPVTNKLYVSGDVDNAITIVDLGTPTPSVLKTIAIGGYIPNITVDAVSNRIYVPNYDAGTVTIIDGATDEVLTVLQVGAPGDGAYDAVVSPVDGALLYVARFNAGEITILRQ